MLMTRALLDFLWPPWQRSAAALPSQSDLSLQERGTRILKTQHHGMSELMQKMIGSLVKGKLDRSPVPPGQLPAKMCMGPACACLRSREHGMQGPSSAP